MKLRVKIFLSIGGLFFLGFVIAQYFEREITAKSLIEEEKNLQATILTQDEARRQNIERYVKTNLEEEKEKIAVLFSKVQNYPWLYSRFAPTSFNAKNGTWLQAASLIDTNKWIDFIQNTNEGLLTSQIIIDENFSKESLLVKIDENLSLCLVKSLQNEAVWEGPYVAIPYDYQTITFDSNDYIKELSVNPNVENGYSLIFSPQSIKSIEIEGLKAKLSQLQLLWEKQGINFEPSSNYYQVMAKMVNTIGYAKDYLDNHPQFFQSITLENRQGFIQSLLKEKNLEATSPQNPNDPLSVSGLSRRFDQIINVWQITTLLSTKIFGGEPFSEEFPLGICQVYGQKIFGNAFMNSDSLFDQLNVYTKKYQGKIGTLPEMNIVIYKDLVDRLFFAGVLSMTDQGVNNDLRRGTLTIGINAKSIVRNLSLAANAITLFMSGGQVLVGFDGKGEKIALDQFVFPKNSIENKKSGFVTINQTEYFFLLIKPYHDVDMNFFILSPKDKEFAFVTILNKTAKNLIEKMSIQTNLIVIVSLIVVLILLNHIVKNTLKPISILATACEELHVSGLKNVQLPDLKKNYRDEVYTLYSSFKKMILGLKEKEKVMGVLNKVVSPTIAQEILKGKVHLGGEEKVVTVLFADIRNFTHITEKMPPHDVIFLLNTCMTKVSDIVDKHHGVIDKYVGDEVMALFGAPLPIENAPLQAIECAVEIHHQLSLWNEERVKEQLPKVEMGIGIHTGLVIAGNMGAENRLNYTVVGSNVNLSSRLCSICPPNSIIVTLNTVQFPNVLDSYEVKQLDPIDLKGFSEPIQIYQICSPKKKV
jgi:class 3 adenylate cyclase